MPVPARLAAEADLPPKQVAAPPLAPVEPAPALPTEPEPALVPSTEVATTEPPAVEPITTVEPAPALPSEPPIASSTPIAKAKPLSVRPAAEKDRAQTSRKRAIASPTRVATTQPLSVRPLATVEPAPSPPAELALLAPAESPTQPVAVAAEPRPMFRAPLPLGRRYGIENGSTRIILRVHRSIRLAVQGTDNRIFIDRILDAGDTYRVPNLVGLKLSAPDAGAIEVILDDTTIGFAGKDGVMASGLSLEPQSIMDRRQQG
jgi:cytoskeleton protein RodZ